MHHFLPFRVDQYWGAMVNPSIEKEKYFAGTVENSLVPLLYLSEDSEGGWHITKGEAVNMNGYRGHKLMNMQPFSLSLSVCVAIGNWNTTNNMLHSYLKKAVTFSGVTTRGPVPWTLRAYSMCTAMCVTHPNSTCSLPSSQLHPLPHPSPHWNQAQRHGAPWTCDSLHHPWSGPGCGWSHPVPVWVVTVTWSVTTQALWCIINLTTLLLP